MCCVGRKREGSIIYGTGWGSLFFGGRRVRPYLAMVVVVVAEEGGRADASVLIAITLKR